MKKDTLLTRFYYWLYRWSKRFMYYMEEKADRRLWKEQGLPGEWERINE